MTTKLFDNIAEAHGTTNWEQEDPDKFKTENGVKEIFIKRMTTGVG